MDNQTTWNLSEEDFKDGKTLPMVIREKNAAHTAEVAAYEHFQTVLSREDPEAEKDFMTAWGNMVTQGATFNETEHARREFLDSYYKKEIKEMFEDLCKFFMKDLKTRYNRKAN